MDGRTDMTQLTVSFRNFTNAPIKSITIDVNRNVFGKDCEEEICDHVSCACSLEFVE